MILTISSVSTFSRMTSSDRQEKEAAVGKSYSISRRGKETQTKCSCKSIGKYPLVPGPSKAQ